MSTLTSSHSRRQHAAPSASESRFDWPLCYEAESFIEAQLRAGEARHAFLRTLARRLQEETGTLLIDWVDHLVVAAGEEAALRAVGFVPDPVGEAPANLRTFWHPEALLPRVLVRHAADPAAHALGVALRVESLAQFLAVHGVDRVPEGAPLSRYRRVLIAEENGARLEAIERRGYRGYLPAAATPSEAAPLLEAIERWQIRRRSFSDDAEGFRSAHAVLDKVIALVGRDLACHVVFAVEREYWQSRNQAARVQKARQDRLGLGWANHDHHTFRSSREQFVQLMQALEKLGFARRERFYAGEHAGWGAQVLEQPIEGIVTFCDVDLLPHETEIDFSRQPLPPAPKLGTIGLWVGLHGESFLDAGMHHLECRFDFDQLRAQLATEKIGTMAPFSDFAFLRQAFTEGERWPVSRTRVDRLRQAGLITQQQAEQFLTHGALGSHLENLQRKGGFKGFNQKSVSVIISATDPRAHAPAAH